MGEPEHIDQVDIMSECHVQFSGTKVWRLTLTLAPTLDLRSVQFSGLKVWRHPPSPSTTPSPRVQFSGSKVWRLRPPDECAETACRGQGSGSSGLSWEVLTRPGEMLCLSIDKLRHLTYLPAGRENDLHVDVAFDLTQVR